MPHRIPGERLIAFFSRRGNNYVNGTIVHLSRGNTEIIAEKLQHLTGGELFRLETVNPYPEDYRKTTEAARRELQQHIRPELKGKMPDMEQFRLIFLGFPNWWGTMPMAVQAFMERHDFSGKIIAPFCTHEGSGMGHSEHDIRMLCPGAEVLPGLAIRGGSVPGADGELTRRLHRLNLC